MLEFMDPRFQEVLETIGDDNLRTIFQEDV
jgi:hypothetical protein